MRDVLEKLIVDFWDRELPTSTPRRASLPWMNGKADAVIGMRRAGKTWLLYQVIREQIDSGTPRESILYLNFEDERLLPMQAADLAEITETFFRLSPQARAGPCAFFFDEVQVVPGWERFVRRLIDTERAHVCVTGSSAALLSRELATSLRGRAIATELLPFDFAESLRHAGVAHEHLRRPPARTRSLLESRFRAYLTEGGFPEVQGLDPTLRVRVLQDYVDLVVLRDVAERHGYTNLAALRYLTRQLLQNPSSLASVHRLYNDLRSQGIAAGKTAVYEALDHLIDAFLVFAVPIHTHSERVRAVNPRKFYGIDPGLLRAVSRRPDVQWGHLLENHVYLTLRRRDLDVAYYRTRRGHEVDFLTTTRDGRRSLVQVCTDPSDPPTRRRELDALGEAMEECGLSSGTIVTLQDEGTVDCNGREVELVPGWWWSLRGT